MTPGEFQKNFGQKNFGLDFSRVTPGNQTKERPVHELFPGHSGTKVRCESRLFSQGKTPEFTKMGEIHELFVLALSLVWFAGATPEFCSQGISGERVFSSFLSSFNTRFQALSLEKRFRQFRFCFGSKKRKGVSEQGP